MADPIYQTIPYNLVNIPKSNSNPLVLNTTNTIKPLTKENKFDHNTTRERNNVNILSTKLSNYCNEKCPKCGQDICICKCS